MPDFFDAEADSIAGTKFTPEDLTQAKLLFRNVFEQITPEWPYDPQGPLAVQWASQGQYPTTYLIHVAYALSVVSKNLTQKSVPVFYDKIKSLFYPAGGQAFEETLIELEVAALLVHHISPISFEPFVPEELWNAPQKPKSPDFGLLLPDSELTIEVTRWHWQAMQTWDNRAGEARRRISDAVVSGGLRRSVQIELPMPGSAQDLEKVVDRAVLRAICTTPSGCIDVPTVGGTASIRWTEMPHFADMDSVDVDSIPSDVAGWTVGGPASPAISSSLRPVLTEQAEDSVVTSLRKALDRKHAQSHPEVPHVLVMALGHHRLHWDWLLPLIETRIWANPRYSWISTLGAFVPARNWEVGASSPKLSLNWNPNAAITAPASLRAVADDGATFHR